MTAQQIDTSGFIHELGDLYDELEKLETTNAIDHYDPYAYQIEFHNDIEKFRCLRAGLQLL